jgi:hypothetical protein
MDQPVPMRRPLSALAEEIRALAVLESVVEEIWLAVGM